MQLSFSGFESVHLNGPRARQLLRALVFALIALSLLAESGAAKPYSIGNASQQGFVNACRENGGTTKRLSTRVVECTLPNGYVIVCNFNSGLCIDYPPQQIVTSDPGVQDPVIGPGSRSIVVPLSRSPIPQRALLM